MNPRQSSRIDHASSDFTGARVDLGRLTLTTMGKQKVSIHAK